MRNKYSGTCYRCGKRVEVGDGHFERVPGKGWRVQHASCAIRYRGMKKNKNNIQEVVKI